MESELFVNTGGNRMSFSITGITMLMLSIFVIAALGYMLGRINIKGVSLGTAGVFIVALLFGAFFPTLLSMAGIRDYRTVQHVDGVDFTPLLLHPRRRHQRTLLFHFPNVWVRGYQESDGFGAYSALLQGDHHLIYFWASRQFRLYNRRRDIAETHDLSETHPRLLRRLAQQLTDSLLAMQAQRPSDLTGSPVPWPIEALTNKNRKK